MSEITLAKVEDYLNDISYLDDASYEPSLFALDFINFIKLANGEEGEEHASPVAHYKMLDTVGGKKSRVANLCSRGLSKTTLMGEYLILYLAVYGELSGFGKVNLGLYVSDSIENGVKNLRKNLEYRRENSEFLMYWIPEAKFTDVRWEFKNRDGKKLVFKGYGAMTGVRGAKEMGQRPTIAILDDLISDSDAKSPTVIQNIEDTVYKAVNYALHPTRNKIIWSGTPFNAKDPLYKAVESGAWSVNVFPVCERFPCSEEDFRGAWLDRFNFQYVKEQYEIAKKAGMLHTFNQELMLRIMSDEDRLIRDADIGWYERKKLMPNIGSYNVYITTDFATTEKEAGDFSVISVWAHSSDGTWFFVDGICKKQLMDKNIDDLFILAQKYRPQGVGVEVSGQQGGFIQWIQNEMMDRKCFFTLASGNNENNPGIRPNKDKMSRFQTIVPMFKTNKMMFPSDLEDDPWMIECMDELKLISAGAMRSKHDDVIDTISMLTVMKAWRPSEEHKYEYKEASNLWEEVDDNSDTSGGLESYLV